MPAGACGWRALWPACPLPLRGGAPLAPNLARPSPSTPPPLPSPTPSQTRPPAGRPQAVRQCGGPGAGGDRAARVRLQARPRRQLWGPRGQVLAGLRRPGVGLLLGGAAPRAGAGQEGAAGDRDGCARGGGRAREGKEAGREGGSGGARAHGQGCAAALLAACMGRGLAHHPPATLPCSPPPCRRRRGDRAAPLPQLQAVPHLRPVGPQAGQPAPDRERARRGPAWHGMAWGRGSALRCHAWPPAPPDVACPPPSRARARPCRRATRWRCSAWPPSSRTSTSSPKGPASLSCSSARAPPPTAAWSSATRRRSACG